MLLKDQLECKQPEDGKNDALSVRLDRVNYVLKKTKMALEKALQDGHQVKCPAKKPDAISVTKSIWSTFMTDTVTQDRTKPAPVANGNKLAESSDPMKPPQETPEPKIQPRPEVALNYQRVLDSLEYSIAQFNHHQSHVLQVHEQSLKHQNEYIKTFFQLMQQQNLLFANGKSPTDQAQTEVVVIESSERSMMRFHEHQGETLRIHEEYLNHQMEYANNFFQFIQQQYGLLITGDSTELEATPVVNFQNSRAILPTAKERAAAKQDSSVFLTNAALSRATNGLVTSPYPASSNGSRQVSQIPGSAKALPLYQGIAQSTATVEPPAPVAIDFEALSQTLLTFVTKKTDYPAQVLDLDMEEDLGIDALKRVEILGALLELVPDLPKPNLEEVAQWRTLGQIVEYARQWVDLPEKKMLQNDPQSHQGDLNHNTLRCLVRLKTQPSPDFFDFTLPDEAVALITDDGSLTTSKLAHSLTERGWKVVVLSFPQFLIAERSSLPEGITRVLLKDLSEEHLKQHLAVIDANYGQIAAFIHLNPSIRDDQSKEIRYIEAEAALVKQVFVIAKHLKQPLNQAARQGRSCFITVAHLDGEFGTGRKTNFGAIGGGLFGLTKTLNQEWSPVFCRAIDLSPDLAPEQSVQYILAELHDPNRLITEVGYTFGRRTTLVCIPDTITERAKG